MKNLKKLFFVAMVMCLSLAVSSCNKKNKQPTLTLSATSISLNEGETYKVSPTIENATDNSFVLSSSDESIVSVENDTILAVKQGTATITVTLSENNDVKATLSVIVNHVANPSLSVDGPSAMYVGDTATVSVELVDSTDAVTVTSSDSSIISVNGKVLTANAEGSVTITVSAGSLNKSFDVEVSPRPAVSIEYTTLEVLVGRYITLTANLVGVTEATWSSSDESIATVTNGKVIGVKEGTVTITLTSGELSDEVEVTVKPVPSITIVAPATTLEYGQTLQLTATLVNLEGTITWTSSNTSVATVDANGLVTAVGGGKTNITASCNGKSNIVNITVTLPSYDVTFVGKDGETIEIVSVELGSAATAPSAPAVDGYEFDHWEGDYSDVRSDLTITAVYARVHSIAYVLNEGIINDVTSAVTSAKEGTTVSLPTAARSGFKFLGWSTVENASSFFMEITINEDVTLYANWEEIMTVDVAMVGGDLGTYATIAEAYEAISEGGTIIVYDGTYNESLTIEKSVVITTEVPDAGTQYKTYGDYSQVVITGTFTIASDNVALMGLYFNAANPIVISTAVTNFILEECVLVSKPTTAGTSAAINSQVYAQAQVYNSTFTRNAFVVDADLNYTAGIVIANKAINVEISNNYFSNSASTTQNSFAIRMDLIGGYINISNNYFDHYAGDFWTIYTGLSSVENNTIIDVIDNKVYDSTNSTNYACGFAFYGLKNDTMYINVIGNSFSNAKDTVLAIRGTANGDTTSDPHVNIKYNKFLSISARVNLSFATTNYCMEFNYNAVTYTAQSTSSIVPHDGYQKDYISESALDEGYKAYKDSATSDYVDITYETNGGSYTGSIKGVKGTTLTLGTPKRDGYAFLGWSVEEDGTDYVTTLDLTEDVKLYANWEKVISFNVTYNFNGGYSEELFVANHDGAVALTINNYNYSDGTFWGGKYSTDVFIGTAGCDPTATFSDRIYIGKNKETGLYEVIEILRSGASSWADGAEYVITISNSISGYYATYYNIVSGISVGDIVAFSEKIEDICNDSPAVAYFFSETPKNATSVTVKVTSADSLIVPGYLGYRFIGWYDNSGKLYSSILELDGDTALYARWEELNPVTDINVTDICSELVKGETYQIVANVLPTDAYFQDLYYSSSNEDIIQVSASGVITAVNAGTATVTITDYLNKASYEQVITVYAEDSIDATFSDGYNGYLVVDQEVELLVKAYGKNIDGVTFTYASNNPNVATVSDEGVITGVANGTAEITITAVGMNANLTIAVVVGNTLTVDSSIDGLLALLVQNSFATVEVGNVSLYDDGSSKVYVPVYGSVNRYLFDTFSIDETYYATTEANPNNHRSRRDTDTIEFVTVHDTATLTGTVVSIASGMSSGETSIHYTVGNNAIYGVVPEKYIAYHAGDGTGTVFTWTKTDAVATANVAPTYDVTRVNGVSYLVVNGVTTTIVCPDINGVAPTAAKLTHLGPVWKVQDGYYYIGGPLWASYSQVASKGGNNNSIGIEMCTNLSGDIYDTWQRTAQLVTDILIRNNLDTTRVKMHNTWSGKNCPQDIIAGDYWSDFMKMVELNYTIQTQYAGATITMVSNNPDIVDNTGRVVNAPSKTTTVSYTITVSLNGETRSITLNSVIPGTTTWEQWNGTYPTSKIWNNGKFQVGRK